MAVRPLIDIHIESRPLRSILTAIALGMSVSACGHMGPIASLVDDSTANRAQAQTGQNALNKALVYWGQEYAKNPGNSKAAVAFAKNLKAAGKSKKAFSVLQQATMYNSKDAELASEYGRLALAQGQTKFAQKILKRALNPNKPDWRVLSALGTTYAKTGNHPQARKYYQQALQIAPGQSSIVNNLALSYALDGKAEQAEQHLRKAVAMGGNGNKIRQNLALVLGVQGRYNDAKSVVLRDLTADKVRQNVAFLQDMVNKPEMGASAPSGPASRAIATVSKPAQPDFRGTHEVPHQDISGSWNTQVASVDSKPITLTPSRH